MKKLFLALFLLATPLQVFASDGFVSTDPSIRERIARMMDEVKRLTTPGMGYVSADPSIRARILAMTNPVKQYIPTVIPIVQPDPVIVPVVKKLSDLEQRILIHNNRITSMREKIDMTFKPASSMADMYTRARCETAYRWTVVEEKLIQKQCYAMMDELEGYKNASIW